MGGKRVLGRKVYMALKWAMVLTASSLSLLVIYKAGQHLMQIISTRQKEEVISDKMILRLIVLTVVGLGDLVAIILLAKAL